MTARNEAIALLEKAKDRMCGDCSSDACSTQEGCPYTELFNEINDFIALLKTEQPPASEHILVCKCGWYGEVDDQDALGSECGCCPDCGNEDLIWLNELQARLDASEASRKELLTACVESQKAIMLLYECNKDVEIALGSGIQLKKAEKLLEAAIEKETNIQTKETENG